MTPQCSKCHLRGGERLTLRTDQTVEVRALLDLYGVDDPDGRGR
jgi:hypothetical protein